MESSLRDGFNKGWDVIILSDAAASRNGNFYKTTLDEIKENFGRVIESMELFKNLRKVENDGFLLKVD